MNNSSKAPTLTDAEGMGGVNALTGFDYQLWDVLCRLPGWLLNPAFEAFIIEGLEDYEARFFAPHAAAGRLVDRFQGKSAQLQPREVKEVFEKFRKFENAYPNTARVQTLVTQRMPQSLEWLATDTDRVRKARPFYAPFRSIVAASDGKLLEDLVNELGDDLGGFVMDHVDVSERVFPDRNAALHAFASCFDQTFPHLNASARSSANVFAALESLGRASFGKPLSRAEAIATVAAHVPGYSLASTVPVHIRSDRNGEKAGAVEIDASPFSGDPAPYPAPEIWSRDLLGPLQALSRWLSGRTANRVSLSGSYRLSTAFALGWAMRAASGFEIEIETRDGVWRTDDHPTDADSIAKPRVVEPKVLLGSKLVAAVGVLRKPADDLIGGGISEESILRIEFDSPIPNARAAQLVARAIKSSVDAACGRLRPTSIDLYLAGPAALVVALGHRWNALPRTQLHEYIRTTRSYTLTVEV